MSLEDRPPADTTVIVLAYGDEPYLADVVDAVLASSGVRLDLVVVDNGCTSDAVRDLPDLPQITVLRPAKNLGFTGGVNLAATHARTPTITLLNSDAVVRPDTIALLVSTLRDDAGIGIAGSLIVLADRPATVNSAGNPLHVLGLSWAGSMGEPAASFVGTREVASASGACLAVPTDWWQELGGFPDEYFAYLEDLELGWRTWQHGRRVVVVSEAVTAHYYEFGRSPLKMYLLERNRLILLLTTFEARTLLLIAPALLAFEAAIALVAVVQGWGGSKVRGWRWLVQHRTWVRHRRAEVQASRTVPDRDLTSLVTDRFEPAQTPLPSAAAPLEWLLRGYWHLVRRAV
ncbi:glycosyltransferase family 2 protein [Cellulomonas sp. ICMP 17802]|uniref:glycosyltransferase family 2 protein n=1 Tax=Cellulomonas sp. ICMP 17802 TaxID=3239199 RepID=UPI00351B3370